MKSIKVWATVGGFVITLISSLIGYYVGGIRSYYEIRADVKIIKNGMVRLEARFETTEKIVEAMRVNQGAISGWGDRYKKAKQ